VTAAGLRITPNTNSRTALPGLEAPSSRTAGSVPNGSTSTCAATSATSSTRSTEGRNGRCSSRTGRTSGRASGLRSRTPLDRVPEGRAAGTTPEEAFFVRCDRTTMTQNDLDPERLVCLVGVAPGGPPGPVRGRTHRSRATRLRATSVEWPWPCVPRAPGQGHPFARAIR
jgi:hypothetical protein